MKETPCGTQDQKQVKEFIEAMKSYELTMAEKLQLLNLRPRSAVEIYLVSLGVAHEMVELEARSPIEHKNRIVINYLMKNKLLLVNRRM